MPVIGPHPCQHCLYTPGKRGALVCPSCYGTGLGPQGVYMASTATHLLFGGQAGGGKSFSAMAKAASNFLNPRYSALMLRQTRPELFDPGGLWDIANQILPAIDPGVKMRQSPDIRATSSSGAVILFSYMDGPRDHERYKSSQFFQIFADEASTLRPESLAYMFSRIRSTVPGIPRQMALCTNPGGRSTDYIVREFAPWLDPEFKGYGGPAKPWEKRHFINGRDSNGKRYAIWCAPGTPLSMTANFIPAGLNDNPSLSENDPDYATRLTMLDMVNYERLAKGNWLIKEGAGLIFKREWFNTVSAPGGYLPDELTRARVRVWDFAATEGDGDWTVGARWSLARAGYKAVEQVERFRHAPGKTLEKFWAMAKSDPRGTTQIIPQDPGAAGKIVADTILKEARQRGARVRAIALAGRGNKVERSRMASAQAWRGEIRVMPGPWLEVWLDEHSAFPDQCLNDDQVDTTSDAQLMLDDFAANGRFTQGRDA